MSSVQPVEFKHRFDDVRDYLHHRSPYLLIDEVVELTDDQVIAGAEVQADAFFVQGHFPGAPVLPGAMMQEMTTQAAGVLIAANYNPMQQYDTHDPYFNEYALGVLVKVKHGRYRGFARPGDTLTITATLDQRIGDLFDFSGKIQCEEKTIYRNQFQLTNMRSDMLRGSAEAAKA